MRQAAFAMLLAAGLAACSSQQTPATQTALATGPGTFQKIPYRSAEELARLRATGAQIVVLQPDYAIVRSDSALVSALAAFPSSPAQEKDWVQRLVHIHKANAAEMQQIVDAGVDVWEIQPDTVVARAYDVQLEALRQAGLTYRLVAESADTWEGRKHE